MSDCSGSAAGANFVRHPRRMVVYNRTVQSALIPILSCACAAVVVAQAAPGPQSSQPRVQYNIVNVCSLSTEDRALMERTLAGIPAMPVFSPEYEVARGRAGLDVGFPLGAGAEQKAVKPAVYARWVRIRREFPEGAPLVNVQYSLSASEDGGSEMLVLRVRDAEDVMMLSISDSANGMPPAKLALAKLPADRIRIERFGKPSVTLARCPGADQAAYEPLFASATRLFAAYKRALRAAQLAPEELLRPGFAMGAGKATHAPPAKPAPAKTGH